MVSKFVTSLQNPIVKQIQLLQTKKSARKKENAFVIEGLRGVNEIPKGYAINYIVTSENVDLETVKVEAKQHIIVPEDIFKQMSDTKTPQGVMAVVSMQTATLETLRPKKEGFYLLLENVQDPGNLGTMIRTAYGFGVEGILITKGSVDVFNPKTIRSTMGAVLHVPIVIDHEVIDYVNWLEANEITLYATDLEGSRPLAACDFTGGVGIAIGNEANGISELVRQVASNKVRIPMPGGLESLNASIAASICMYEVMRQRIQ